MSKTKLKKSIFKRIRNNFFAGAVVLIPIGITLYLTLFIVKISTKIHLSYYLDDIESFNLLKQSKSIEKISKDQLKIHISHPCEAFEIFLRN